MSRKIFIGWFVLLLVSIIVIIIGISTATTYIYTDTQNMSVRELNNWEITKTTTPDESGMYYVNFVAKIPLIHNGGETLMFYTYHSNVSAYVEGRRIYRMSVNQSSNNFPVVLGDVWNQFVITKEHEGKHLQIVVETPYESYLDYVPVFEFGNELDIVLKEFKNSAFSIILSLGILVSGMYLSLYSIIIRKNENRTYSMFYLGIFAILMSTWFLINIPTIHFIIGNSILLTYLSYILLGAIAVPFMLFEKQIMNSKYSVILNGTCFIMIAVQMACLILQLAGIYDMKESLFITHIALGIFILSFILVAFINIKTTGIRSINRVNLVNIACAVITAVGVAIDLALYYSDPNSGKEYIFSKTALLIYILALAYNTVKETEELMKKAKEAERLEMLAYLDELTGVCNRTAYNKQVVETDLEKFSYTVFMFDLNDLKKCNDTLGHHYGDEYIRSSAHFIKDAFKALGTCYRIGGDEFCIIAENVEEGQIKAAYTALNEKVNKYNQEHDVLHINIACGHARYDKAEDKDLEDTRQRADKLMYENKIAMKKKNK